LFIDTHFHLGYQPDFYYPDVPLKNCLIKMDKLNIAKCINAHNVALLMGELRKGMEECKNIYENSEGRIISYLIFNPKRGKKCIQIMDEYLDKKIFKGIKIHPSIHRVYADDQLYDKVWKYAADKGIPIMSHTWEISDYNPIQKFSFPPRFENYIKNYPNVTFICGHAGGRYKGILECVKLLKKYNNVYADVAGDVYNNNLIKYLVENVGSDKILFGSDGIWVNWNTRLGMILNADILMEDKENILFKNAKRLFEI